MGDSRLIPQLLLPQHLSPLVVQLMVQLMGPIRPVDQLMPLLKPAVQVSNLNLLGLLEPINQSFLEAIKELEPMLLEEVFTKKIVLTFTISMMLFTSLKLGFSPALLMTRWGMLSTRIRTSVLMLQTQLGSFFLTTLGKLMKAPVLF